MPKSRPLRRHEIEDLPKQLVEIAEFYEQLPTLDELDRDTSTAGDEGGGHKPGPAAPINLTVLHLTDTRTKRGWRTQDPGRVATIHRFGVLPALMWWVQLIEALADRNGVQVPGHPDGDATVATECAWLTEVQPFILAQPGAVIFVRDIARIHAALDTAVSGNYEFKPRCGTCSRILTATDDGSYSCSGCGRVYSIHNMVDLGRRHPPMLAREITKTLKLGTSTIRQWERRGLITPVKRNSQGRKLYSLADALRLKERVRLDTDK